MLEKTISLQKAAYLLFSSRKLKQSDFLSDDALKLESIFGSYFVSVFRPDDHRPSPPFAILNLLIPELEIASSTVSAHLECLTVHKAAGPDDIHPQLLNMLVSFLVGPLTFPLNKILVTGVILSDWQTASDNNSSERFKT